VQGSLTSQGQVRVHKITAAVLYAEITIAAGAVQQSNFDEYRVLGLPEAPEVDVRFVDSGARVTGLGEPATPPLAPAVANAVFAAGQRLRRLPFAHARP
jgi:isoquinoline 1-oxidoreductase subunit beta